MRLIEQLQICSGFVPVDLQTAANTGDYVSLKNYKHLTVVFFKAAGTAGDDPTLALTQATDVAGTGVKALTFTELFVKQGTLTAIGEFTKVTQSAAGSYTEATSAESQAIWVVEIDAEDLDIANGFTCVKAAVADVGTNAQLGCLLYFLSEPKYNQEILPSAIID